MPGNYYKRMWNMAMCMVFIYWLFLTPIYISRHQTVGKEEIQTLQIIDLIFMLDRILDLFIGFYNTDGTLENRIYVVIFANLNTNLILEALMVGLPILVHQNNLKGY
jgi:hypothetical protein